MQARLLALALLAAACTRRVRSDEPRPSPVNEPETRAKVVNDNVVDMDVYVVSGGMRFRLGRVSGGHTQLFTIPRAMVHFSTTLGFEMRALGGGGRSRTDTVTLNPGDQITLIIPP